MSPVPQDIINRWEALETAYAAYRAAAMSGEGFADMRALQEQIIAAKFGLIKQLTLEII